MAFKLKQSNIVSSAPINKIDMEDGVLGKANRDGTIDINKDITDPQQEREVIEHEKMHLEQMQRGDLDYDDKNVYWKGKKYPRSKMDEGAKNLPWEKEVYDRTENMNKNFKLKGPRGQSEPMSALSNRGLIKPKTKKVKVIQGEGYPELSDYSRSQIKKGSKSKTKNTRGKEVTITKFNVPKSDYKSYKDLYKQDRKFFDEKDNELSRNKLVRGDQKSAMILDPKSKTYSGPDIIKVKQQSKEVNRHLNRGLMGF
tara:strand:- start:276 stop:1040 length:765 start_codon:yes stop_codon:yes gene_type:complete